MKVFFTGKNAFRGLKSSDPTSLATIAEQNGVAVSPRLNKQVDLLVCMDLDHDSLRYVRKAKSIGVRTCLVASEPTVVVPQYSKKHILKQFDKTIFVGRAFQSEQFKWPQTWTHLRTTTHRRNNAVIINADKWSFVEGQNYWLRAAISTLDSRVVIYGPGWARTGVERLAHRLFELVRTLYYRTTPSFVGLRYALADPINYMGTVENKVDVMSQYKVALVIENSSELLTEKLFDAWFAGCIPVYVGPSIADFGLPADLVVTCGSGTLFGLQEGIEEALTKDHQKHLKILGEFLDSQAANEWRAEKALSEVLRSLDEFINPL